MQLMSLLDRILEERRMLVEASGHGIGHEGALRVKQNHVVTALATIAVGGAHTAEWESVDLLAADADLTEEVTQARHNAQQALQHLWNILDRVRKT